MDEYQLLPLEFKEELCVELLSQMGVSRIRNNPISSELTHPCQVSEYHTDQDRNPTASLNYDKLVFHCLGCKASGSLTWFIATVMKTSSKDARKWLASKGAGDPTKDLSHLLRYFDALYGGKKKVSEPMPSYHNRAISQWGIDTHPYLENRGIPEENIKKFRLGYNSEEDAIIIPHYWEGKLVGWQSRMVNPLKFPKYMSTPSFPKRQTVFNYDKGADRAVIVEAPISVVKHEGNVHFESTISATVTETQIRRLERHREIILWFDNDHAGWEATRFVADKLLSKNNVWVVDSPFAGDPADLPTEMVEAMITSKEFVIPYVSWQKPEVLLCHKCYDVVHEGGCESIAA